MKTARKAILLVLCVILLVVASVMGTLAYLTDADAVTNTFTVGKVDILLDEADVDENGEIENSDNRVKANEYHLLPGHTYIKDPTVTVKADSDNSYIRMLVKVKNVDSLKEAITDASYYYNANTDGMFLLEKLCTGWDPETWLMNNYKEVTEIEKITNAEGDEVEIQVEYGIYEFRYFKSVATRDPKEDKPLEALFENIVVPGEINNDQVADLGKVQIIVEAHAIQADGFTDAADAWNHFSTT